VGCNLHGNGNRDALRWKEIFLNGNSKTLFTVFGFSVKADPSWLILAVLVLWTLAEGLFPSQYEGYRSSTYWAMAALGMIGLFGSIILHELGHSLVARRFGLPIKDITLFVFGGVADMEDEPPNAKVELAVALAGPVTSMALAALFFAVARLLPPAVAPPPVAGVLVYLVWINAILAVFNLIPAFPLDGGRVLRALLWSWRSDVRQATQISSKVGSGVGWVLILLGAFVFLNGHIIPGLWWFFIGMFMRTASQMSYRHLLVRRALAGESLRRFMKTDVVTVPRHIPIRSLVEEYIYKYHYKFFPVLDGDQLRGCVSTRHVRDIPREEWDNEPVSALVEPCSELNSIPPQEDPLHALSLMNRTGNSRLMVVEDGRLVGIVTLKDMLEFLVLKLNLEGTGL